MKSVLIILTVLLPNAFGEDLKDLNLNELVQLAEDISVIQDDEVTTEDVKFYTIKPQDQINGVKILIHGWLENHRRSWYHEITEEYLKKGNYSIVQVDWERPARSNYISSAKNTKSVGYFIAKHIINAKMDLDTVHLIGHSLGAHVAAFTSKELQKEVNQKVYRISALDPAGPYFRNPFLSPDQKLMSTDAKIVDVFHTDGYYYGYESPTGTLDMYFNGGSRIQPGCLSNLNFYSFGAIIEDSFCSHHRSCVYFIEAINRYKIHCTKCTSWEDFQEEDKCTEELILDMKEINENQTGICYVTTNSKKPFLAQN